MKLHLPEIEISSDSGFDKEIDIFGLQDFGERLASLIEKATDNPVIALDAEWGEGKTTFIKMWCSYVENVRTEDIGKLNTIYFDAFKNDYQKDPFLALASEIHSLFETKEEKEQKKFQEKASGAIKALARGAIKISVGAATAGLINSTTLDSVEKEISNLVAGQVDSLIEDRFKNIEKDRLAIDQFKEYLTEISEKFGNGKPIVFIIDELDRCRPDFALELIEQVKHLFSVKGFTFLLVTNRTQLEESIKVKYGQGINATNYLHKFVNLWLNLPPKVSEYADNRMRFIKKSVGRMTTEGERIGNLDIIEIFGELSKIYLLSLREIQRMLSYFAILQNMIASSTVTPYIQNIIALICFLKVSKPDIYKKIKNISYEHLISEIGLDSIEIEEKNYVLKSFIWFIKYDLSNTVTRKKMLDNDETFYISPQHGVADKIIHMVVSWFSSISREY